MKRNLWFGALAIAVAVILAVGCASVQRRVQDTLERASIPVYLEDAQAELNIVTSRIETVETWLASGESVKQILHLNDKTYAKLRDETEKNLVHLQNRKVLLEKAIEVLPKRPAPVAPVTPAAALVWPERIPDGASFIEVPLITDEIADGPITITDGCGNILSGTDIDFEFYGTTSTSPLPLNTFKLEDLQESREVLSIRRDSGEVRVYGAVIPVPMPLDAHQV